MLYGEGKLKLAREYVAKFADGESYKTLKPKQVFPSIEGLALAMDITRETVYQWQKDADKSEFADIVTKMLGMQAAYLTNNGLDSTFNASISKLILSKHGYIEETKTDSKVDQTVTVITQDYKNAGDTSSLQVPA